MFAEIELLMCNKVSALEGVHFRKVYILERVSKKWDQNEEKLISEADYGSRNIPFTAKLINFLISKLSGLSIEAGKITKKRNYLM